MGFLAAFREGGGNPWAMGVLGAAVTLWATFAPCFLWIFAGAPYIERLNAEPRLRSALAAVTAAVVGVILNLTVWFALQVLFARVGEWRFGPVHVMAPDPASLSVKALLLSALAAVLLFALHRGVVTTLGDLQRHRARLARARLVVRITRPDSGAGCRGRRRARPRCRSTPRGRARSGSGGRRGG